MLAFTGNDVAIIIPTSKARYTPKGRLHGNDKVSLSKGFVKCNIIQRGKSFYNVLLHFFNSADTFCSSKSVIYFDFFVLCNEFTALRLELRIVHTK